MIEKMVQRVIKVKDKFRNRKKDQDLTYRDNNNIDTPILDENPTQGKIITTDSNDNNIIIETTTECKTDKDKDLNHKDMNVTSIPTQPRNLCRVETIMPSLDNNTTEEAFCKIHEQKLKDRVCNYLRDFETKRFVYDTFISFRRIRLQIISRIYERHKFRARRETQIMQQLAKSRADTISMVTKAAASSIQELGKAKIMLDYVEELKKARGIVTFARQLSEYRIAQIYDELSGMILKRIALVYGWDPEFRFKLHRPLPENLPEFETLMHLILNSDKCRAVHPKIRAYYNISITI